MSSTKRGSQRNNNDYYATPAWVTDRLLKHIPLPGGTWLEPSAGDGAIVRALLAHRQIQIHANEIDSQHQPLLLTSGAHTVTIGDFFDMKSSSGTYDVCIGNPPFALAEEFVEHSVSMSKEVVFLLRLGFLESKRRRSLFDKIGVPDVYVLPERPSFINGKTDSCAYGWFRWYVSATPRTSGELRILYGS